MALFWRLVNGTESSSYSWTFDTTRQAAGCIVAYSGVNITVPPSSNSGSTTTAGTSLAGVGTNSSYETGLALQFYGTRNTTGASSQTAGGTYVKREDTCTTASVFMGIAAQDATKGLTVGGTATTGNTCTVASTAQGFALFLEDARPAFTGLAADQYSEASFTASANTLTATSTQANVPNTNFLAWISINKDTATVSSIATGGLLTWSFVTRVNTNAGCLELWQAFAAQPFNSTSTIVTLSTSVTSANCMVVGFIGADPTSGTGSSAIGAVATGTFTAAAPSISLVTTRNNSWVWAVANSSNTSSTITAGSSQTIIRTQTDSTNATESWMWRQSSRTATTGTTVTMNATAPAAGTGNILAVEVLTQRIYNLSTTGSG
jgi:hypothetical protein